MSPRFELSGPNSDTPAENIVFITTFDLDEGRPNGDLRSLGREEDFPFFLSMDSFSSSEVFHIKRI